jgi:hypothetical protein
VARLLQDLAGKRGLEHGGPLVRSHTLNKGTVRGKNRVNFPPVTGSTFHTVMRRGSSNYNNSGSLMLLFVNSSSGCMDDRGGCWNCC